MMDLIFSNIYVNIVLNMGTYCLLTPFTKAKNKNKKAAALICSDLKFQEASVFICARSKSLHLCLYVATLESIKCPDCALGQGNINAERFLQVLEQHVFPIQTASYSAQPCQTVFCAH